MDFVTALILFVSGYAVSTITKKKDIEELVGERERLLIELSEANEMLEEYRGQEAEEV